MFPKKCMRPIVVLAPLAGLTTPEFRAICSECGADLVYSEMVSARGLHYGGHGTLDMLKRHRDEKNLIVQMFGDRPDFMAKAAKQICEMGIADGLDINFGCPVKKVARSNSGAVLMKDLPLAREIVQAVVESSQVPVSIKCRLGWSPSLPAAHEFIVMAQESGCSHVIVHGRWATQFYGGTADMEALKEAVQGTEIPVLANGDICSVDSAKRALEITGCQGVAIGRAILGRPDLFTEIRLAFDPQCQLKEPPPDGRQRRAALAKRLLAATSSRVDDLGRGAKGYVRLRGHLMSFMSGFKGAAVLRQKVLACNSRQELDDLLTLVEKAQRLFDD